MESNNQNKKYLVVALGNDGINYHFTWHNVAWLVVDLINRFGTWEKDSYARAYIQKEGDFIFVKPLTMMNLSGLTVSYLKDKYKLDNSQIIIMHDDLDLNWGQIKLSYDRGSGGHNGIKSIVESIGSTDFIRFRIGIQQQSEDLQTYYKPDVMGVIRTELREKFPLLATRISEGIKLIREQGITKAQSTFNQEVFK